MARSSFRFVPAAALVLLAGCSTSGATRSVGQDCVDATRPTYGFVVESPTSVVVTSAPSRKYRVSLAHPCPELERASGVGFANGPARWIGRGPDGMPLWANSIQGSRMICGHAGDRLTIREVGDRFDAPSPSCKISGIQRL
jgi:hypothetical protein